MNMVRFVTLGQDGCEEEMPQPGGTNDDDAALPADDRLRNESVSLTRSYCIACLPADLDLASDSLRKALTFLKSS